MALLRSEAGPLHYQTSTPTTPAHDCARLVLYTPGCHEATVVIWGERFKAAEHVNNNTITRTDTRASVDYAACLTASINVGSLLSAFELLICLETAHRCK
jgi:hypothetical protein